jgi:hypothetical protein
MTNQEFIQSISTPGEEWRDAPGFEGYCMVSNKGRAMSCGIFVNSSFGTTRWKQPKLQIMKPASNGYCSVTISVGGKNNHALIHRLVAKAFIPNPDNKPEIDHIDTIRSNNEASNLRWCTKSENNRNPITLKKSSQSKINKPHPHNYNPVVGIRDGIVTYSYRSAKFAEVDGFSPDGIYQACKNKRKTYKGMIWMYLSDYERLVQYVKELYPNSVLIRRPKAKKM